MSITLTDPAGRTYTFSAAEVELLDRLMGKNADLRKRLLHAMLEADNERLETAIAITTATYAGPVVRPDLPAPYNEGQYRDWTKADCLRDVENRYEATMQELFNMLGARADFTSAHAATGSPVYS